MQKKVTGFKSMLNVDKARLRNLHTHDSLRDTVDYDKIIKELTEKSIVGLMNQIKEEYPDMSEDVIRAFIKTYFLFELDTEYDIKSHKYSVIVTPVWKDVNMIDTDSKDFKLLREYALNMEVKR